LDTHSESCGKQRKKKCPTCLLARWFFTQMAVPLGTPYIPIFYRRRRQSVSRLCPGPDPIPAPLPGISTDPCVPPPEPKTAGHASASWSGFSKAFRELPSLPVSPDQLSPLLALSHTGAAASCSR
jgi:hypothetical protein